MLSESVFSLRSRNKIREVVESPRLQKLIEATKNEDKPLIPLSIGDPTVFQNLEPPQMFIDAIAEAVKDIKNHGYLPAVGKLEAREAIARCYSYPHNSLTAKDVILTNGCSGAIEMIFKALLNPVDAPNGDVRKLLIPSPGFALYETMLAGYNIPFERYSLLEDQRWECNLQEIEAKCKNDKSIVAILVTNPSNPCGAVYSEEHLAQIIRVAKRNNLIIVADEIYGEITFSGNKFHPMASIVREGALEASIISLGGVAKEFLVPGFRVGWMMFYSKKNELTNVKLGAGKIAQYLMGPNSLVQAAIPSVVKRIDEPGGAEIFKFKKNTAARIEENANYVCQRINNMKTSRGGRAFEVNMAQGAMYCLPKILRSSSDVISNQDSNKKSSNRAKKVSKVDCQIIGGSVEFMEMLLEQEQLFVLPGIAYGPDCDDFFRLTLTPPMDILKTACDRLEAFALRNM